MDSTESTHNCSTLKNLTCYHFSSENFTTAMALYTTISTLGVAVSIIAIALIIFLKEYKKPLFRQVLYLILASMFFSVSNATQVLAIKLECGLIRTRSEPLCEAKGFVNSFLFLEILLIVIWMTLQLFALAICQISWSKPVYDALGIIIVSAVSLILSLIPFMTKGEPLYGSFGIHCWIRTFDKMCHKVYVGLVEQYVLYYGPLYLVAVFYFIAILIIIAALCWRSRCRKDPESLQLQQQYKQALKESCPLMIYPIIFGILTGVAISSRTLYAESGQPSVHLWRHIIHAAALPSGLLVIPLGFILHPGTLKKLRCRKLRRALARWRRVPEDTSAYTEFRVQQEYTTSAAEMHDSLVIRGSRRYSSGYHSCQTIFDITKEGK